MRLEPSPSLKKLLTVALTAMALSGTALAPLAEAQRGERVERGDRGERGQRGQRGDQGHRGDRIARLAGGPGEHRGGRGDRYRGDGHRRDGHRRDGHRGDGYRGERGHRGGDHAGRRHDGQGHGGHYRDRDHARHKSYRSGYHKGYRDSRRDARHGWTPRHLNTLPRHLAPRHAPPPRYYGKSYRRDYYHGYSRPYYRTPRYIDRPYYNRYPHRYYKPRYTIGGHYRHYHGRTVVIRDYWRFGLYDPPRGYYWVRDRDRDDAILASVATGAIIGLAIGILAD